MAAEATIPSVTAPPGPPAPPSAHALSIAGVDLPAALPPVVRVEPVREVVVVLSRSREATREIRLDRCRADGVVVLVRPSGGGAVVLAPGAVAASVLAASNAETQLPQPYFAAFGAAVSRSLAACGAPDVTARGVSDLCLGDRKVAGSALRLWRGRALYQVAVLVDMDVGLIERYLPPPSRQPEYRRGRAHGEFVITLRAAGCPARAEEVAAALAAELAATVARLRPAAASV